MRNVWYPEGATLTFDQPPVGSVIAVEHRAVEVIRYDTRPDGRTTIQVRRLQPLCDSDQWAVVRTADRESMR